jgi:hypothetical protein
VKPAEVRREFREKRLNPGRALILRPPVPSIPAPVFSFSFATLCFILLIYVIGAGRTPSPPSLQNLWNGCGILIGSDLIWDYSKLFDEVSG